jgi:uncharacterized protein (TIGR04255 family)
MSNSGSEPFVGEAPASIALEPTPLSGVVAQIQFPEIFSIEKREFIADFQEQVRGTYPITGSAPNLTLEFGPDGARQKNGTNWRFFDENKFWRLSLTSGFLALETRAYGNREDFVDRVASVAKALDETIHPGKMTRIGVRYVNRIYGQNYEKLSHLVREEMLGLSAEPFRSSVRRSHSETVGIAKEGNITVRWGLMPSNETHDVEMMPAINQPSWFLDTDVFQDFAPPTEFHFEKIRESTYALATRAYAFFRWTVKDELLSSFGGKP